MSSHSQSGSPDPAGPLLSVRGLGRRKPQTPEWLLRDIDLDIEAGDRLALLGPTGSGKSLVLRALALLDPIDRGEIAWRGRPIGDASVPDYRGRVLYLQQRSPVIEGTVAANLEVPFGLALRREQAFPRDHAVDLLASLGKDSSFLDSQTTHLSGGERQVVALLRALLVEPTVLLLDEPSAALDRDVTTTLERLVDQWQIAVPRQRAYVWVSHDPSQAERVADRWIRLHHGRLAGNG